METDKNEKEPKSTEKEPKSTDANNTLTLCDKELEIVGNYVLDTEEEDLSVTPINDNEANELMSESTPPPNQKTTSEFVFTLPSTTSWNALKKGRSKPNILKGKRIGPQLPDFTIEKDPLEETNAKIKIAKRYADLAEQSYNIDKLERLKITLSSRIEKLVEKNLITITDLVSIFLNENIPLSIRLPTWIPKGHLSNLLLAETNSTFIETISHSLNMQDMMRKEILYNKHLPVCSCGYIYVHPTITYAQHPENRLVVLGKLSDKQSSVEPKEDIIKKLEALRFLLDVYSEYHSKE